MWRSEQLLSILPRSIPAIPVFSGSNICESLNLYVSDNMLPHALSKKNPGRTGVTLLTSYALCCIILLIVVGWRPSRSENQRLHENSSCNLFCVLQKPLVLLGFTGSSPPARALEIAACNLFFGFFASKRLHGSRKPRKTAPASGQKPRRRTDRLVKSS